MLFGLLPVPIFIGEVLSVFFFLFCCWLYGLLPPLCFLGEVLSVFSVPLGLGLVYSLVVAFLPFGNKFLLIQKKKHNREWFQQELWNHSKF